MNIEIPENDWGVQIVHKFQERFNLPYVISQNYARVLQMLQDM